MWLFVVILVLYILFDVNYFLRTFYTMISGVMQQTYTLKDVITMYGWCTLEDCDLTLKNLRLARIIRDVDFGRYNFYKRTDIYRRSKVLKINSLQGCTLTLGVDSIPLFAFYKINTKVVYWDNVSLFMEHEVRTLHDNKVRYFIVSRQHAVGNYENPVEALCTGIPGFEDKPSCPEYIKTWLDSMDITSRKLRGLPPA